jgi:hypothetical protein
LTFRAPALALLIGIAAPETGWTTEWRFCVGVAPAAHETVITDIFASAAESARIEHRLEAYFRARKGVSLTFQCPRGAPERFSALNAQTAALQFNRKLGNAINGLPAGEIAALTAEEMF